MASSNAPNGYVWWRTTVRGFAIALITLGLWQSGSALWLYSKAALAQLLIAQAWRDQQHSGVVTRPWPWADTHPVAQLRWPRGDIERMVLAGMQGEALAFGPGLTRDDQGSGLVIAGHRDTHFRFLADLRVGDELELQHRGGVQRYRVATLRVVDSSRETLQLAADELVLVTCYPFDAVRAGGPLRYRVGAQPMPFMPLPAPNRIQTTAHSREFSL